MFSVLCQDVDGGRPCWVPIHAFESSIRTLLINLLLGEHHCQDVLTEEQTCCLVVVNWVCVHTEAHNIRRWQLLIQMSYPVHPQSCTGTLLILDCFFQSDLQVPTLISAKLFAW